MNTFYHGTVDTLAKRILAKGLRPVEDYRWNATMRYSAYNPKHDDEPGYVYLTKWPYHALEYAQAKARYFIAKPGDRFEAINEIYMRKEPGAPILPDTKPVLLEVNLTDAELAHLGRDWQDSGNSFTYKGMIPPERIKLGDLAVAMANKETVIKAHKEFLADNDGPDFGLLMNLLQQRAK